ncbi:MAG: hypothetical protein AAGA56_01475 [Myxococcota bacterium]
MCAACFGCSSADGPVVVDGADDAAAEVETGDADGGRGGMASSFSDCEPWARPGPSAGATDQTTAGGIRYNVRTPSDYDPQRAHPLLVVYSPRVTNPTAEALEAFTGLGVDAPARGYVVAFVEWFDPVPLANRVDGATVRDDIAAGWCIDPDAIFLSGHSDGGSMTTLYALGGEGVRAVAPSAGGIDADDGPSVGCNGAMPAMVIHSRDDQVFPVPDFGLGAAEFWAACSGCGDLGPPDANGCATYVDCTSEVQYCEVTGDHYRWYGLNQSMLDFFDRHR